MHSVRVEALYSAWALWVRESGGLLSKLSWAKPGGRRINQRNVSESNGLYYGKACVRVGMLRTGYGGITARLPPVCGRFRFLPATKLKNAAAVRAGLGARRHPRG